MAKKIIPIIKPEVVKEGKSAVGSVSIWGSLVAGLASVMELVQDPNILAIIPGHIIPYIGIAGAILGVFGRVKAKGEITSILPKK